MQELIPGINQDTTDSIMFLESKGKERRETVMNTSEELSEDEKNEDKKYKLRKRKKNVDRNKSQHVSKKRQEDPTEIIEISD